MSLFPKLSKAPPRPTEPATSSEDLVTRYPSGQHPAVKTYRDKLQSITDGVGDTARRFDEELAEYLRTIAPPPAHPSEP